MFLKLSHSHDDARDLLSLKAITMQSKRGRTKQTQGTTLPFAEQRIMGATSWIAMTP